MDHLPHDPAMLVSAVNMLLRDGEYETLDELCAAFGRDAGELTAQLQREGFDYDSHVRRFY
ncbi:MAG: DUF4250 domain-containing protein [Bacteroidaceae bacterium]|nr:DUF4250 domain-containing protein [Bacteroidaceae bacterium]